MRLLFERHCANATYTGGVEGLPVTSLCLEVAYLLKENCGAYIDIKHQPFESNDIFSNSK